MASSAGPVLAVDGSHVKALASGESERRRFASGPKLNAEAMVAGVLDLAGDWAWGGGLRVVNDAAMQALGSYEGGKMLFLGLGTGLGSALVHDGFVDPLELGHLPFRKATFEDGRAPRRRARPRLCRARGGNAAKLGDLPANVRLGKNEDAFPGGFRLWEPDAPAPIGASRSRARIVRRPAGRR